MFHVIEACADLKVEFLSSAMFNPFITKRSTKSHS